MLKLGLLIGALAGAVIATLLAQPKEEPIIEAGEPDGLVDKLKHQVREAQIATQEEMKAKEAEMMADYEASRHTRNHEP